MRRFLVWLAVGGLVALSGGSASLAAQGFSVNEHSTCAMARAGTGVASPCPDGSALFYNPAGLALMPRGKTTIAAGVTLIAPRGNFTSDVGVKTDLKDDVIPVPVFYLTHGFSDHVAAGVGLFAPYGLRTAWPATSEASFLGERSEIRALYLQPTLSAGFADNRVLVGAGFDVNFLHVNLRQRIDLASTPLPPPAPAGAFFANLGIPAGTAFADADLTGNGTGVGYHVGIIIKPSDRVSLGVRYLSRQKVTIDGGKVNFSPVSTGITLAAGNPFGVPAGTSLDAVVAPQFAAGALLSDQDAKTALRMPEQWVFGVAVKPATKLTLLADVQLQHWVVFDTLTIDFELAPTEILPENFENTTAWRFGAEYQITPRTAIRGGYLLHDGAEPKGSVTPNLPEGDRSEFTVGFGTRIGRKLGLDLAFQWIDQGDRRGRTVPYRNPFTNQINADNGLFEFHAPLFGATISYDF
ncbi:MAG TPA: outer membrane protein transport protein [Gemmatimonadales bacterium]|jgi:long-chain fatty acid transport protein